MREKTDPWKRNYPLVFYKVSLTKRVFFKQICRSGGKWSTKVFPLWHFNGFFTHFWISIFSFLYWQTKEKLVNWINNEVKKLWRNICNHMRDWDLWRYIHIGLWFFIRNAVITAHIFTLKISKFRVKCLYARWIEKRFNFIFCYCFS